VTDFAPSRRRVLVLSALLSFSALAPAALAEAIPADLSQADLADIKRIEDYLNNITTLSAKFQQFSEKAGMAFGAIYLKRPGFLRVEYEPPSPMLIVSDSVSLHYYDPELDQISRVPADASPLWFLLKEHVELGGDVTVTAFERGPGILRIGIRQTDDPDIGSVTLELGDKPLELRQWIVADDKGAEVRVGLYDARFGLEIDQQLFRVPKKANAD
jgi:outer membrane lipoprotein-sorting protein